MSTKIENAIYTNPENELEETIYYQSLDSDLYNEMYKGNLTCINGCIAKIKFTEKKNGTKFFSTWNGDGGKHDKDCQYHVIYKGKVGRKKLKALHTEEETEICDQRIMETVLRKIDDLKNLYKKVDKTIKKGTKLTSTSGEEIVEKREYIKSLNAQFMDFSFEDTRKCVYGIINNVQIRENDDKEKYAYLNLDNTHYNVSIYLAPAFYFEEDNDVRRFEQFIEILQNELDNNKRLIFIGVGNIQKKKDKSGLNVKVINKKHMMINETEYLKIIFDNGVRESELKI